MGTVLSVGRREDLTGVDVMPTEYAIEQYNNNVDFIPEFVDDRYDVPLLTPEVYEPVEFVPITEASKMNHCKKNGIHFFVSDYQFQNVWTRREKYRHLFLRFGSVMTPDFSIYPDWPVMVQMWNHYRKHVIGAWMQSIGCKVYPTITWGDERSWDFCFSGEPFGGTVCVSSVGTQRYSDAKKLFIAGYEKMMDELCPETILFYGNVPKECEGNIIHIEPFQTRLRGIDNHD